MCNLELPFYIDDRFKTYPFNSIYLGVLEANGFIIDDIVLKEFMNILCYFTAKGNFRITLRGAGNIKKNRFIFNTIDESELSIEKIKSILKKNNYVMIILNEKFITNSNIKQEIDYYHDWLIYGFDDRKGCFKCAGYVGSEVPLRTFRKIELSYNDINVSMKNISNNYKKQMRLENHYFRINYNWKEEKLSEYTIKENLRVVFGKKRSKLKRNIKEHYNVKAINRFLIYILFAYVFNIKRISLSNIRTIYEHMNVLCIAMMRISNNLELINSYKDLIKKQYKLVLLASKYNIIGNKCILKKIYKELKNIKKSERQIFEVLI